MALCGNGVHVEFDTLRTYGQGEGERRTTGMKERRKRKRTRKRCGKIVREERVEREREREEGN